MPTRRRRSLSTETWRWSRRIDRSISGTLYLPFGAVALIKASQVRRVGRASKSRLVHIIRITRWDEVEAPVTDWLSEAYETSDTLSKSDVALKTNRRLSAT